MVHIAIIKLNDQLKNIKRKNLSSDNNQDNRLRQIGICEEEHGYSTDS